MSPQPLITVLMPVYNQEAYIAEALESVLAQTYTNLRIVVSDDCSTDDSLNIIKHYAAKDKRIQVLDNEQNLGICGNFNKLFDSVETEFVAFFSGDDVMLPEKLARQYEILQANPDVAVVHHDVLFIDDNGNITGNNLTGKLPLQHPLDWALKVDWLHYKRIAPLFPTTCLARSAYYLHARYNAAFKYKHELLFTIEDYCHEPQARWAYIPEMLMRYRKHEQNFTNNPGFRKHIAEERLTLYDVAINRCPALKQRLDEYKRYVCYEMLLFAFYENNDERELYRKYYNEQASLSEKMLLRLAQTLIKLRLYWPLSNRLHRIYKPYYLKNISPATA